MSIETLSDIITELADSLGVYGAHGDEDVPGDVTCTEAKPCRMCFESGLRGRILAAVEIERKLGRAGEE